MRVLFDHVNVNDTNTQFMLKETAVLRKGEHMRVMSKLGLKKFRCEIPEYREQIFWGEVSNNFGIAVYRKEGDRSTANVTQSSLVKYYQHLRRAWCFHSLGTLTLKETWRHVKINTSKYVEGIDIYQAWERQCMCAKIWFKVLRKTRKL